MNDQAIFLNRLAQGVDSMGDGIDWFNKLAIDDRREVLHELAVFVLQAHPTSDEAELAVARSGIRRTVTPAILLVKSNLKDALMKIAHLPAGELERSFRLLVLLLGIADGRRWRNDCTDGCSHWWHQLS